MLRSLLTILIVAALSAWLSRAQHAAGVDAQASRWVRTADGWEPRYVLAVERPSQALHFHPGLVAAFQCGASLFCLLAFPTRVAVCRSAEAAPSRKRRPQVVRAAAVG